MDGYEYVMQKREARKEDARWRSFWSGFAGACANRYEEQNEYTKFWGCKRRGPVGRHNPGCEPNMSCMSLR